MSFIDNIKSCFNSVELPKEPVFRALLLGDGAWYFENVTCIAHYDIDEIVLSLKKGSVTVRGENLYIKKYCAGDVVICGKIKSLTRE
ncbi:MAG: YabP/YqfC family sporulation protein [Clostridia bacterium]|nr:YabP/YqfC family sporulation protein [Clostridia bacterium]